MPQSRASSRPPRPQTLANSGSRSFNRTAVALSRNPIGIFALFITLAYAMSVIVVGVGRLDSVSTVLMIVFICIFPFFIAVLFFILVTKHHTKLYAPADFPSEKSFMDSIGNAPVTPQTKEVLDRLSFEMTSLRDSIVLLSPANTAQIDVNELLESVNTILKEDPRNSPAVDLAGNLYRHLSQVKKIEPDVNLAKAVDVLTRFIDVKEKAGERDADMAGAIYKRACYKVLTGSYLNEIGKQKTLAEAVTDLKIAIQIDTKWAGRAREDADFTPLYHDPRFQEVINEGLRRGGC